MDCLMVSFFAALCGPHSKLTYKRISGHLAVQVEWGDERTHIKNFFVEYKEFNTTSWKEVSNNILQFKSV